MLLNLSEQDSEYLTQSGRLKNVKVENLQA